ncbi:MAG: GmrSD restriction endonuclease domain-containing protein [Clostridium sp.]
MREIHEKLKKSVEFNPTNKTHQMTIFDLCKAIEEEEIVLPLYQRDVSWTLQKNVDLLNYQLVGKAPVSPISMNEIKNENIAIEQVSFIDREVIRGGLKWRLSVTDGQQRLTCNYRAYSNDKSFSNIVLDIFKGEFTINDDIKKKEYQIPVGILLNKNESLLFDYFKKNKILSKDETKNILLQIRNKIKGYNYTINKASDLTEDEQIEWFEVLNNAGSRVTKIEMDISKQRAKGIDAYKEYIQVFRDKISKYNDKLFKQKTTEVSYPMTLLNSAYEFVKKKGHTSRYSPIPSDYTYGILDDFETGIEVRELFAITLNAVDDSIKFIENNKLEKKDRMDYLTYLTGYFVFNKYTSISNDVERKLIDWYKNVEFSSKGNTERRDIFSELLKII